MVLTGAAVVLTGAAVVLIGAGVVFTGAAVVFAGASEALVGTTVGSTDWVGDGSWVDEGEMVIGSALAVGVGVCCPLWRPGSDLVADGDADDKGGTASDGETDGDAGAAGDAGVPTAPDGVTVGFSGIVGLTVGTVDPVGTVVGIAGTVGTELSSGTTGVSVGHCDGRTKGWTLVSSGSGVRAHGTVTVGRSDGCGGVPTEPGAGIDLLCHSMTLPLAAAFLRPG
ncbi:MAG TPA: hypothetical protein VIR33_16900 [Thermopolyspora sp.]